MVNRRVRVRTTEMVGSTARGAALQAVVRAAEAVLPGEGGLAETMARVATEAGRLSGADYVRILLVDRTSGTLRLAAQWGFRGEDECNLAEASMESLAGVTVRRGEVVFSGTALEDAGEAWRAVALRRGIQTHLGLPIRDEHEVIGALVINTVKATEYGPEARECLGAFADFSGIAIRYARQIEQERARRGHLEALQAVIEELGRQPDLRRLLESVLDRVLRVVRAEVGVVYLWDPDAGALAVRAWRGTGQWLAGLHVLGGEGVAGMIARTGQPIFENDFRHSVVATAQERAETQLEAVLGAPLTHRGRLLGVLLVGRERPQDPFRDAEEETLRLFGAQVALALEQARLVSELEEELRDREAAEAVLRRRTRQVEAVSEIGDEVAREVNTKALLDLMATRLIALLDTVGSAVYLCEEGEQGLLAHAAKGVLSHSLLSRRRLGEGLVGAAADARQGILANAYPRSRYVLPSVLEPATVEAAMVEPLVLRGRLLGVLQVVRDAAGGPFTDEDQFAIRLFAKTAALALEHARLFTELSEAFGRLQVLQEEALRVEKLQTLGALTSGMVFGLNQVLAQVLGQVEHLGLKATDPQLRESLGILAEAASNGVSIVRRLGLFVSEQPGGAPVPCDLAEIVMEAASLTQPRWKDEAELEGRAIRVDVQIPELPAVTGRRSDLREVFSKLILHAVGSMPYGGQITISAQHEAGLREEEDADSILVTVRDTGLGMSEYVREHIFDPVLTDPTLRRQPVNLAMVRDVIEEGLGGRVGVSSVLGEGTTFTLRLKATRTRVEPKASQSPVTPVKGRRILVVDDNVGVLRTHQAQLEEAGQLVWCAESAAAALKALEESGPFDVVFTDLGMPGINGWELAEAIKARAPYTPVVLVTGWGEQALQAETRRRAFVERVLFKPVRQQVFVETIAALTAGG